MLKHWHVGVPLALIGLIGLPARSAFAQAAMPRAAQVSVGGPTRASLFPRLDAGEPDSISVPPTHWQKGAAIGGLALGIPALLIGLGWCGDDDAGTNQSPAACVIGGTAVAALVGAAIGALIGGQFPKHQPLRAALTL